MKDSTLRRECCQQFVAIRDTLLSVENEQHSFAIWLRAACAYRQWEQADLAREAVVSTGLVNAWWHGKKIPGTRSCRKIANALGIDEQVVLAMAGHGSSAAPVDQLKLLGEVQQFRRTLLHIEGDLSVFEGRLNVVTHGVLVRVMGRVPADAPRFASTEGLPATIDVLESDLKGAQNPAALLVTGDCWRSIGLLTGDYVIVDRAAGRSAQNGQIVVVRVNGEYTMKRWVQRDTRIELRDGDDRVAATISPFDDYEVWGFYITHKLTASR